MFTSQFKPLRGYRTASGKWPHARRTRRHFVRALSIAAATVAAVLMLRTLLNPPKAFLPHGLTDPADRSVAISQFRLMVVQLAIATGAAVALLYTARTYQLSHRGQVTERFTKALERLGSPEKYVRIGGIRSMEHVARDSMDHRDDVVEVLVAFVTHQLGTAANGHSKLAEDVQFAVRALAHLPASDSVRQIRLSGLDLSGVKLDHSSLDNALFEGTILEEAKLNYSQLKGALLADAKLRNAHLNYAILIGANISNADVEGVQLIGANLTNASLREADLRGANLTDADLSGADLSGADLTGAILTDARFGRESFTRGRIAADLTDVKGLGIQQLSAATLFSFVKLPNGWLWDPADRLIREPGRDGVAEPAGVSIRPQSATP